MTSISAQSTSMPPTSAQLDPQLIAIVQSLPAEQQQQALAELQAMTPEQQGQLLASLSAGASQQQTQVAMTSTAADSATLGATALEPPSKMSTILKNVAVFGAAGAALGFGASFLTLPIVGQVAAPIAAAVGGAVGILAGLVRGLSKAKQEQSDYDEAVAATATTLPPVDQYTPAPEPVASIEPPLPAPVPDAAGRSTYTVRRGDNLSVIAERHGMTWQELYRANREAVGDNPHLIHPGLRLSIPE